MSGGKNTVTFFYRIDVVIISEVSKIPELGEIDRLIFTWGVFCEYEFPNQLRSKALGRDANEI